MNLNAVIQYVRSRGRRRRKCHECHTGTWAPCRRAAFSLLEIILALAILAGSLAALGEVMRLADQNASLARDESQAQILASSLLDELISGARELMAVNQVPFELDTSPPWAYSIALEQTGMGELVAVRILVEQQMDANLQPARFELIRWLPNPDFIASETDTESSSSTSGSSSSQTSGTGASSSTGGAAGTSGGSTSGGGTR